MGTDWQSKYKEELEKRVTSHKLFTEQFQKLSALVEDLQKENEILKDKVHNNNYLVIDLLRNLVDTLERANSFPESYSSRLADHAFIVAHSLEMPMSECRDIYVAALMTNIGLLTSGTEIPARVFDELPEEFKKIITGSPEKACDILSSCKELRNSAEIAYSSRERVDGSGYPNGWHLSKIPKGSLVISAVADYYEIMNGTFRKERVLPEHALNYLRKGRDYYYDRPIVDKLLTIITCEYNQATRLESKYRANMLKEGMILSRPLTNSAGSILLRKDHTLTQENIDNLLKIEDDTEDSFLIFIKKDKS
jgi:response regulator RpfG family c-di-GMP phosphodiesterase